MSNENYFYWFFKYFIIDDSFALERPRKRTQSKLVGVWVVERESLHWTQRQAVVNHTVSGGRGENTEERRVHKRLRKALAFQTEVDDRTHWTFVHHFNSELLIPFSHQLHLRLSHHWFTAFAVTFFSKTCTQIHPPFNMSVYVCVYM